MPQQFLRIENRAAVIPDAKIMHILGASSSRGSANLIGQFGSGFLYLLALLARHNLLAMFKLCLGKDVYTFEIVSHDVNDSTGTKRQINEIMMRKQNGGTINLNISTDFGAIDWRDVTMAVRELVSNAIDGSLSFDGTVSSVKLETQVNGKPIHEENCRAKDGLIRAYVPLTETIDNYYANIKHYFICLRGSYDPNKVVFESPDPSKTYVYRRGVMVYQENKPSLFAYNLKDCSLNECRVLETYQARQAIATALFTGSSEDQIEKFLNKAVINGSTDIIETMALEPYRATVDHYIMSSDQKEKVKTKWRKAINKSLSNYVMVNNSESAAIVRARGHATINHVLAEKLIALGATAPSDVLNIHDLEGRELTEPTPNVIQVLDKIWKILVSYGLTGGKDKPKIMCYNQVTMSKGASFGYYKDSTVFINNQYSMDTGAELWATVLHEIAHHVTGATDYTPDFQEYAFKVAGAVCKNMPI